MAELDLSRYSTTPLFNTKAVVQQTGVPAATLRAWERRYAILNPDRSQANYRLYSEQDIALVRWLHEQVSKGLTISQAVELYRRTVGNSPSGDGWPSPPPTILHGLEARRDTMLEAFAAFDEQRAEMLLNELFALYPVEQVLVEVVVPVMVELGERWHRGEITIAIEHFATAYVVRRLMALMNAQAVHVNAPLVVTGCAQHEHHEMGILLVSLFLRRAGVRVLYLGQNVPVGDLCAVLQVLHPAMLALSATSMDAVEGLRLVGELVEAMPSPKPDFAFGGGIFDSNPSLIEMVPGMYLGNDAHQAVQALVHHLRGHALSPTP